MRSAEEAAAYAIERANSGEEMHASGYCLQFTRECYPMEPYYFSAIDAWNAAEIKHPGGTPASAPPGFPAYFLSSSPYDHVAVSIGDGDFVSVWNEEIRICSTATMLDAFGPWLGYCEDLNQVRIYSEGSGPDPTTLEDEMRLIRSGSSGTISLVGDGWYLPLGDDSVNAFVNAGYGPVTKLATADYNTIVACLKQGSGLLADAKSYAQQTDATLDSIVAAFRNVPGVDAQALSSELEGIRADFEAARAAADTELW